MNEIQLVCITLSIFLILKCVDLFIKWWLIFSEKREKQYLERDLADFKENMQNSFDRIFEVKKPSRKIDKEASASEKDVN